MISFSLKHYRKDIQLLHLFIYFCFELLQKTQKGVIGITLISQWFVPFSDAKHDQNAAKRALDFMLGWYVFSS
jgi:hypothetical protein